ncbi:MAG: ion channel [Myxococcales bacterium]|nr:ion channel [Myxococcales bacterium]
MPQRPRNVRRFGTLLGALLLMMVILPFLPESRMPLPVISVVFTALLVASVYAVSQQRRVLVVGLMLAAPTLVLAWVTSTEDSLALLVVDHVASIAFLAFVIAVLFTRILRQQDVSTDTIYGGICVYLLLGLAWAYAYDLIEIVNPGSFAFAELPLRAGFSEIAQVEGARRYFYFSFVTLTTLGYGEITPVSPQARSIATLEAVAGPLFLAIFIARLVGLHMVQAREDRR